MSPLSFEDAYERFQAVESAHAGRRLESFRDASTLTHREEGYKDRVAAIAVDRLAATIWKKKQVGTGEILDAVIAAIEHKDNNLLRKAREVGVGLAVSPAPDNKLHWIIVVGASK
jgi:hypothetical protein